jgi:hypothetical protein
MNNYDEEIETKLSLVIRKPQEGKTFICINSIVGDSSQDIHIVLTMNTLAAGMQFFGRMEEKIGSNNIIVYNSDKETAGNCHHAKTSGKVVTLIKRHNISVIVCCAHKKRFSESLREIFTAMEDSIQFAQMKRKFKLHIDEAHKYIPENRNDVRMFNQSKIVSKIVGYSASPDPIFTMVPTDHLFNSIYICDVEKEYGMIRSSKYFGVIDCEPLITEDIVTDDSTLYLDEFEGFVPPHIVRMSLTAKEREKCETIPVKSWYGPSFPFSLGNEKLYLGFITHILPQLALEESFNTRFSYHFVPAYCRKITHYQTAEIILRFYTNANVIIINGNGIQLFRLRIGGGLSLIKTNRQLRAKDEAHKKKLLEPSFVIQSLIEEYPNCPTFITGLVCVGMSVTLVNETLGNFDNIVVDHHHYKKEDLYQLCRFLFNYTSWAKKENGETVKQIKITKFISLKRDVYDTCLDYESYIERLTSEFSGMRCALNDVRDIEAVEPTPSEIRKQDLKSIEGEWGWKRFKIDGEDEDDAELQWARATNFYKKKSGRDISNRSKPSKYTVDPRFLVCAINGKKERYTAEEIEKKIEGNKTWDGYFQLRVGQTQYTSRIYVGYDNLEDPTKYTLFIKWSTLNRDDPNVHEMLAKYYGKMPKESAGVCVLTCNDDDDCESYEQEEI